MGTNSVRRFIGIVFVAGAGVAQADTWLCTQSSGHKTVATINPTVPHWECKGPGGATTLSAGKVHAQCVPMPALSASACRVLPGDLTMALRVGMRTSEVAAIYGEPQARELRATMKGTVAVWLYEARPGPHFPIVYKDAQVSGWGPAYLKSISSAQSSF